MSFDTLRRVVGDLLESDAAFGSRTTYRVGGRARGLLRVADRGELERCGDALSSVQRVYILGNGSNTLVSDEGFEGLVITLGEGFTNFDVRDDGRLEVGAGLDLPVVARRSVEAGLRGFEWAVGVPGTVGGAVAMNAGGHGSDMAASVQEVEIWDLEQAAVRTLSHAELGFGYRRSVITSRMIVLSVTLQLSHGDAEEGRTILRDIVRWRREHQPGGANAGSVFQNPTGESAGAIIDGCGLKGCRIGTAHVSDKHANFIQVDSEGRANDVAALMRHVHDEVLSHRAIDLHTEIRLVGFDQ